jgi:hypothetical protein
MFSKLGAVVLLALALGASATPLPDDNSGITGASSEISDDRETMPRQRKLTSMAQAALVAAPR